MVFSRAGRIQITPAAASTRFRGYFDVRRTTTSVPLHAREGTMELEGVGVTQPTRVTYQLR